MNNVRNKNLTIDLEYISNFFNENKELFKYNQKIQNSLNEIGKGLARVYEETPGNLLNISKYGWFLDFGCKMKYSFELNEFIVKGRYDLAEKSLITYYSSNLDNIIQILSERHPTRKKIFDQIKEAHNHRLFYLSIPIIFTQVDGICNDLTNKKFFLKTKKHLPEVYTKLKELQSGFVNILLAPIETSTPFNVWEKEIDRFPYRLNRHEILHGIDIEYGNNTNFLKSISLLKYISDLIIRIDK